MDSLDALAFRLLGQRLTAAEADETAHMIDAPDPALYPARVAKIRALRDVRMWMEDIEKSFNNGDRA